MADGNALGAITRTHAAQKTVLVAKQFECLDNDRSAEQFSFQHGLFEDFIEPGVTRVLFDALAGGTPALPGLCGKSGARQGGGKAADKIGFKESTPIGFHKISFKVNLRYIACLPHQTQSFQSQERIDLCNLGNPLCHKLAVTPGGHHG